MSDIAALAHARMSYGAVRNNASEKEQASSKMALVADKREHVRALMDHKEKEIERLSEEMIEEAQPGFFEAAWEWLTSQDDVGDLQREQKLVINDVKASEGELKMLRGEQQDILDQLRQSDGQVKDTFNSLDEMLEDRKDTAVLTRS